MSVILRCTNDNGVIQDIQVQDQLDLRLDISAIENTTIGDVYGISSQDFSLVGSNEVKKLPKLNASGMPVSGLILSEVP
jgi:hypothetical protein